MNQLLIWYTVIMMRSDGCHTSRGFSLVPAAWRAILASVCRMSSTHMVGISMPVGGTTYSIRPTHTVGISTPVGGTTYSIRPYTHGRDQYACGRDHIDWVETIIPLSNALAGWHTNELSNQL